MNFDKFSFAISQTMILLLSFKLGLIMVDFIFDPNQDIEPSDIYFYLIIKISIFMVSTAGILFILSRLNYLLHKVTIEKQE